MPTPLLETRVFVCGGGFFCSVGFLVFCLGFLEVVLFVCVGTATISISWLWDRLLLQMN